MDDELKHYLEGMESRMEARIMAGIERRMGGMETLIDNISQSLQREMEAGFADMKARFDRQDARLERHGGLIQGGSRSMARVIDWSENADRLWAERDERMRLMEERIKRLEERGR